MGDAGKSSSTGDLQQEITTAVDEPSFIPRRSTPNQLFGTGRGEHVRAERQAAAAQIQRTLRVWRKVNGAAEKEKGNAGEAAGPEVSEPGEPAEKEADTVADAVADKLHGDGEAKDGNGKPEAAGAEKAPEIGAKLEGVGRKVFLAKDPNQDAFRKQIEQEGAALVQQFKQEGVGADAGRSGGHGDPYKRAGAELIRKGNAVPKNDPRREIYKTVGNRLIEKGKSISHPGKR